MTKYKNKINDLCVFISRIIITTMLLSMGLFVFIELLSIPFAIINNYLILLNNFIVYSIIYFSLLFIFIMNIIIFFINCKDDKYEEIN